MNELQPNAQITPPEVLLRDFVEGAGHEAAFTRLVVHFEKLIFSSAYRRSGNAALAEDVTQVVFTVLARKAPSLIRHPALTAWVFQTTKLETMKAIRTEARRKRKHDALRKSLPVTTLDSPSAHETEAWRESAPYLDSALDRLSSRDRELILKRFFENQKFKDIAASQKTTVGACKMQLKRALTKLSAHLPAGNRLSVTTLGAGLFTTLASAPPASASAIVAKGALSQAAALSTTNLVTNTLLTMTNTQKMLATCAALLTVSAVPAFQMMGERSRLDAELLALTGDAEQVSKRSSNRGAGAGSKGGSNGRNIDGIFNNQTEQLSAEVLLKNLSQALVTMNGIGRITPFLAVPDLSDEELLELILEVEKTDAESRVKSEALRVLLEMNGLRGDKSYQEKIELLATISGGQSSIGKEIKDWGKENPTEALAWLKGKGLSDEFTGAGARSFYEHYLPHLLSGVMEGDPELGLKLYSSESRVIRWYAAQKLTAQISQEIHRTESLSFLEEFLSSEEDAQIRSQVISRVAIEVRAASGDLDRGGEVLELLRDESEDFAHQVSQFAAEAREVPLADRLSWLEDQIGADAYKGGIGIVFERGGVDYPEAQEWISTQTDELTIDHARVGLTSALVQEQNFDLAYREAIQINDEHSRLRAIEQTATQWLRIDPEAARLGLPESALRAIEGQPIRR